MLRTLVLLLLVLAPGAAQALENVTLQLKWRHQFQFAGYYAALEKGYYSEAGLHVRLVEATPDTNVVDEVVSGRAQYGVGTSDLLLARSQSPVMALAVIFQHSPLILLAREDRVGNLHQLAGQDLMLEAHAEELLAYLRKEGLPPASLRIRPHSQSINDLVEGKIAAMSAYSTTEPYFLRRAGFRSIEFSPRAVGIDFYGDNLFTSKQELRQYPERVQAFRAASLRGWEYALQHPDEIIALILARYNTQGLDQDMLNFEAERTQQLIQSPLVEIGYMNPGRWQHIANIYAELGMQPKGDLPAGFLYDGTGLNPLPAWLSRTAVLAALTILVLSGLVWRNMRLSRQLRCEIAAQEQAHRQLADIEQHTRFKLENSADTFWEMDTQFRFTYISAADYRTRGFQATEVIGRSLLSMLTPASLRQVREEIAQLQQAEQQGQPSGPLRFEFEIYCKDGSTVWAESNSMPLRDANGHIVGYHGVTRDITAQKRQRTELIQVNTQLGQQLQEIQVLQTRLQDQAIRDALTGLFNRRYLDEALAQALDHAQREGEPLALIMVDIDLFKHINDTHGHPAGDEVIRALGNLLRQNAREGDMACRYGGEEFIMALPRMNLESARARAEQWRQTVETLSVQYGDTHIRFTISAGVAAYPAHANEHERLMACADAALYASKNAGRNRVTCFDATAMAA